MSSVARHMTGTITAFVLRHCQDGYYVWQFYLSLKTEPKEVFYIKVVGNFISFLMV